MAMPFQLPVRNPRETSALLAGGAALLGLALWAVMRRPATPEERERLRRDRLAEHGRIVDGALVDVLPGMSHPQLVLYRYRVAGVVYECTQDISALAHRVRAQELTEAFELPIQVRYERNNPGNSIVLAEVWNGLWSLDPAAVAGQARQIQTW